MKHLKKFNESRIYGHEILPEDAIKALDDYVDINKEGNKVEVVEDPRVYGAYAVQVTRDGYTFHLLWNRGAYDEVEFDSFPPTSSEGNMAKNIFM